MYSHLPWFGWRKKTVQGECASPNPWQAVLLHFKGIASGRSVLPNKKEAISGKHRLWSPDQYKIKNSVPHTVKPVLPNCAFWRRAKNDIEGFHVAFTSEWIRSALDIKILWENLLLSSSSIPASPVLTLLMHVTSRITQASLPTEQCPNLMSMQSITQSQIITALELCPAHLPKQLHFCFQWLAPKLFWQMSHYLSTHDSFDRKKRALCDIHHSTTIKKQLFPAGCCSQRARAQHTNPCVRLSQVTACADQHLETPLKQRDRAGSPGPPCQVFPCWKMFGHCNWVPDTGSCAGELVPALQPHCCTQKSPGNGWGLQLP